MKGLTLVCLLLVLSTKIYGQKLIFDHIGVRHGLPASEVYNLHQDKYGYVWIFTEYGIVKYNGRSYVPVCTNLTMKHAAVYAVTESVNRNMYFINSLGEIYRVQNNKAYKVVGIKHISDKIVKEGQAVYQMYFFDNGDLELNTVGQKSYRIPGKMLRIKGLRDETPGSFQPERIHILKRFPRKDSCETFLISSTGVIRDTWKLSKHAFGRHFYYKQGNRQYYSKYPFQLYCRYPNGKENVFNVGRELLRTKISPDGHVWVCTYAEGVFELDKDLNVLNRYLQGYIVSDILFDNQNGVWISTIGNGVFHCDNRSKKAFPNVPAFHKEISYTGVVNNRLLIGTVSGHLYVQEGNGFRQLNTPAYSLVIVKVMYLEKKYYVSTKGGTFVLNDKLSAPENFEFDWLDRGKLRHVREMITYGIESLTKDELLFISPSTVSIYRKSTRWAESLLDNGRNRYIVKRHNGEFLIAVPSGIQRFRNRKFDFPSCLNPLREKHVLNIVKDKLSNVWFCTKGDGLYCLTKSNKLFHYTELPSTIIFNISITDENVVLLSSNNGAFVNRLETLNNKKSWKLVVHEETHSMTEFGKNIYIGTKGGLIVIRKNKLFNDENYKFYLTNVRDERNHSLVRKLSRLAYFQNNLYFDYDLLDFQPHDMRIEYELSGPVQLNGVEESGQLHFQNLSPGEYTLKVYPKMGYGEGKKMMQTTRFTIQPAFWQTRTFFVVILLLFTAFVVIVYSFLVARKNKREKIRSDMEKLLIEYRLTALKSQINPHFMSNSLVAIQNLILQNDTDGANLYLAKFSLLLRSLLDYSNRSYASVRSELGMLELYIELEQLRFSNKFTYELILDDQIDLDDTIIPTLITQPFVENAIWHGLLPLDDHSNAKLTITIKMNAADLHIAIDDNGVGRSFKKETRKNHISKGTELIMSRLETLNQLYNTNGGRIVFVDKVDENGIALGTKVVVVIPGEILNELYDNKDS